MRDLWYLRAFAFGLVAVYGATGCLFEIIDNIKWRRFVQLYRLPSVNETEMKDAENEIAGRREGRIPHESAPVSPETGSGSTETPANGADSN